MTPEQIVAMVWGEIRSGVITDMARLGHQVRRGARLLSIAELHSIGAVFLVSWVAHIARYVQLQLFGLFPAAHEAGAAYKSRRGMVRDRLSAGKGLSTLRTLVGPGPNSARP